MTRELERVEAWRAWEIYADYDANAPDTVGFAMVATRELADDVCAWLNEDPEAHSWLAFVDGFEHAKSFKHRPALADDPGTVCLDLAQAKALLTYRPPAER